MGAQICTSAYDCETQRIHDEKGTIDMVKLAVVDDLELGKANLLPSLD